MTLSRAKPLRTDRTHSWGLEPSEGTFRLFRCSRCGRYKRARLRADLPEKWCNGLKQSELERTSRLSPVSRSNSGGPETFGPLCDYARSLGCVIGHHEGHTCKGEIQAHHVRSRGAGFGDRWGTDEVGNVVGLCWRAHHDVHTEGKDTFERRYSINLKAKACTIGNQFGGGEA